MQRPLMGLALILAHTLQLPLWPDQTLNQKDWKSFVRKSEHYSVSVPPNWPISDSARWLGLTNFSRGDPGGLLPSGGAVIRIMAAPDSIKTFEQWAASSRGIEEVGRSRSPCPRSISEQTCLQLEQRYDIGPEVFYRRINFYFTLSNKLYSVMMEYRESDVNASEKIEIFRRVVNSITPIRK